MILVDSSVWVDFFNEVDGPKTEWLISNIDDPAIALCDLVLCEVLRGFERPAEFTAARKALLEFPVLVTGGTEMAIAAAEQYQALRQRGITIRKLVDCLIASYCIREGHSLLHNDRDFDPFEKHLGLRVIHP